MGAAATLSLGVVLKGALLLNLGVGGWWRKGGREEGRVGVIIIIGFVGERRKGGCCLLYEGREGKLT